MKFEGILRNWKEQQLEAEKQEGGLILHFLSPQSGEASNYLQRETPAGNGCPLILLAILKSRLSPW